MKSNRKTAVIVGVLFITATVAAIVGGLFILGSLDAPDSLVSVSANESQMLIGVLFELILAGAVVGIGVMMFPIFKKHNETLALGYVGARIFEAVVFVVGVISLLSLLTLSQEYVAGAPDASYFQILGTLLLAVRDWTLLLGGMIFLGLGALMFYYLLYQSKLIPRFLSVWGLLGATLVLLAGFLNIFGYNPGVFLSLPIAVNEMVLAVWLIVKGFKPSAIVSVSAKTDIN